MKAKKSGGLFNFFNWFLIDLFEDYNKSIKREFFYLLSKILIFIWEFFNLEIYKNVPIYKKFVDRWNN